MNEFHSDDIFENEETQDDVFDSVEAQDENEDRPKTKKELRKENKAKERSKSKGLFKSKKAKDTVHDSSDEANDEDTAFINALKENEKESAQEPSLPKTKKELRKEKKKKTKGKGGKKAIIIVSVILVVLLLLVGGGYYFLQGTFANLGFGKLSSKNIGDSKAKIFDAKSNLTQFAVAGGDLPEDGIVNILVFGFDSNESRIENSGRDVFLTDAIMVFHIDINKQTIKILSIPRDSYVPIYNQGWTTKINAAYAAGYWDGKTQAESEALGLKTFIGTVSNLLNGLKIHYYVGVNMDGFKEIIDELGGVKVTVPQDLYSDNGHGDVVVIKKGEQTLSGKDLLYYARYRAYARGDVDRTESQQNIMKSTMQTLTSKGTMSKLPQVYNTSKDIFITSMSFEQIASLAYSFKSFNMANLETKTAPGSFLNLNGVSYWKLNESSINSICKSWYGL